MELPSKTIQTQVSLLITIESYDETWVFLQVVMCLMCFMLFLLSGDRIPPYSSRPSASGFTPTMSTSSVSKMSTELAGMGPMALEP